MTAHDAFRDRDPDDIETLRTMTQDRREVMSRLRESYFEAQTGLAEDERVFLFELTNTFTRVVYFLNSMATLLPQVR